MSRDKYPKGAGSNDIESRVSRDNATAHDERGATIALQKRSLAILQARGPMTADQVAADLDHPYANVRPRLNELAVQGRVYALEETGRGANGGKAILWAATPPDKIEAMAARRKAKWLEREQRRFAHLLAEMGIRTEGRPHG